MALRHIIHHARCRLWTIVCFGFEVLVCAQTVVDKRKLVNIGTKMGVGLGSVMGTLVAMGNADLKASANATDVVG